MKRGFYRVPSADIFKFTFNDVVTLSEIIGAVDKSDGMSADFSEFTPVP